MPSPTIIQSHERDEAGKSIWTQYSFVSYNIVVTGSGAHISSCNRVWNFVALKSICIRLKRLVENGFDKMDNLATQQRVRNVPNKIFIPYIPLFARVLTSDIRMRWNVREILRHLICLGWKQQHLNVSGTDPEKQAWW